jgi:hypothetical protein
MPKINIDPENRGWLSAGRLLGILIVLISLSIAIAKIVQGDVTKGIIAILIIIGIIAAMELALNKRF